MGCQAGRQPGAPPADRDAEGQPKTLLIVLTPGGEEDGAAEVQGECFSKLNPDFYAARPTSSLSLQQPRVASSLPAIAVALRPKHESSTRGAPFSVLSVVWVHVFFNNNGFFGEK